MQRKKNRFVASLSLKLKGKHLYPYILECVCPFVKLVQTSVKYCALVGVQTQPTHCFRMRLASLQ